MKRTIILTIAVVSVLCAAATDRFYIENFTINPGETLTVSIQLDNEATYTAFQSDIYLPAGLTASNFALTSRKNSSHTLTATELPNGGIRLLSYSITLKAYKNNSGALVTFDVTAANNFAGDATIALRNTLFTTVSGVEIPFDDEECMVTLPTNAMRGDVNDDHNVSISDVTALIDYLLSGDVSGVHLVNADCNHDGNVSISDVTTLIDYLLSGGWPLDVPQTETFTVNGVAFEMIHVEGGTFTMGGTAEQGEDAYDQEFPIHQVTLSDYAIGQTEVTQALWIAVMGNNPSNFTTVNGYQENLNRPVENVTWDDCQIFIAKLNAQTGHNFRLPTEAEWEFAARGGNKSQSHKYAGSDDVHEVAWFWSSIPSQTDGTDGYGTQPVGTKKANELGLYDMNGNVWEWCEDWYGTYSVGSQVNPTGPVSGTDRVNRGGSWSNYARYNRVTHRRNYSPSTPNSNIGLRLVLDETVYTVNGVSFTMIPVKGGTFTMGATPEQGDDALDAERPTHQVTLSHYAIGQTEVTQALWVAVMGDNPSRFTGRLDNPVEGVTWNDCQEFITQLNAMTGKAFRLLTEAEWEYAARGGDKSLGYKYAGSNDIDEVAWYSENCSSTQAVGTKKANELGIYDMSGNVWEWCQDYFGNYSSAAQTNPTGPKTGTERVRRGVGWNGSQISGRVSHRSSREESYKYNSLGLRLAL